MKRSREERAQAVQERLFRGWDLRVVGCVWQLGFLSCATIVGAVVLWSDLLTTDRKSGVERLVAFPGLVMVLFAITAFLGLLWLQWSWWRRYRAIHPMFYRRVGKTLAGMVVTLAIGMAGACWIYLFLFR